jgi:hypothetical protein
MAAVNGSTNTFSAARKTASKVLAIQVLRYPIIEAPGPRRSEPRSPGCIPIWTRPRVHSTASSLDPPGLTNDLQRSAEEGVEVLAEGFVFFDCRLDGFLGCGALVAKVGEGGEDVFGGGSGGDDGRRSGHVL